MAPLKQYSLTTLLKKKLRDRPKLRDAIVMQILERAEKGELPFVNIVLERVDGKVPDRIELKKRISSKELERKLLENGIDPSTITHKSKAKSRTDQGNKA